MYTPHYYALLFLAVLLLDFTKCQERRSASVLHGSFVYVFELGREDSTKKQASYQCSIRGGKLFQEDNYKFSHYKYSPDRFDVFNLTAPVIYFKGQQLWGEEHCYEFSNRTNITATTSVTTFLPSNCSRGDGHICEYSISSVYFYKLPNQIKSRTEIICGISSDDKRIFKGMQIKWKTSSGEDLSEPKECNTKSASKEVRIRRNKITGPVSCQICGDEAITSKIADLPTRPVHGEQMELQVTHEQESIKFSCTVTGTFDMYTSTRRVILKINNKSYANTYATALVGEVESGIIINDPLAILGGQGNVTCAFGFLHKTETFHEGIDYNDNGFLVNTASGKLSSNVAEIVEGEGNDGECEGTFLHLVVRDFTVPRNKTLQIKNTRQICYWSDGDGDVNQTCIRGSSQPQQNLTLTGLIPRTNYSVKLSYRPYFWTRNVTLTRTFRTNVRQAKSAAVESSSVHHDHDRGEVTCTWKVAPDNITSIQHMRVLKDGMEISSVENNTVEVNLQHQQYADEEFTDFMLSVIYCNGDVANTRLHCAHFTKTKMAVQNGTMFLIIALFIGVAFSSLICLAIKKRGMIPVLYRTTNRRKSSSNDPVLREAVFFNNTANTVSHEAGSSGDLADKGPSTSGSSAHYENIASVNPEFQGDVDEELYVKPNPPPEKYLTIDRENDYESIKGIRKKKTIPSESKEGKYETIGNVFGKEDPTVANEDKYETIWIEQKITADAGEDNYIHLDQSAPSTSAGGSPQQADGESLYDVVEVKERKSQHFGGEYENYGKEFDKKAAVDPSEDNYITLDQSTAPSTSKAGSSQEKADGESVYDVVEVKGRTSRSFEGFPEYP